VVVKQGPVPASRFAFKLLRELAKIESKSNLFFSPFSIMMCLLMLYEGATGETREAIAKVLEIADETLEDWPSPFRSLLERDGVGARLVLANSLWCDDKAHVRPEFVAHVRDVLGAETFELPLQNPSSIQRINAWVAKKTEGKIDSILAGTHPFVALVAVNAIYFKGKWTSPFQPVFTRVDTFYPEHESAPLPLSFMRQSGTYHYFEDTQVQAVRIPYGDEERLAGYIILPWPQLTLSSLQGILAPTVWDGWMRSLKPMKGLVAIPRFRAEYQGLLNPVLHTLGMAEAMDPKLARFENIAVPPPPIWIDRVLHRALVEVNEEGTEAIAETTAACFLSEESPKREPTFEMIVDRPFLFVIRDDQSDTILFMGCIHSPQPLS
jgi:serpin B